MGRLGLVGALLTAATACRGDLDIDDACQRAMSADRTDPADVCLAQYRITRDRATGARASIGLGRKGRRVEAEGIARDVGDTVEGADAWFGVGVARRGDGDTLGAIAAFQRALLHYPPTARRERVRDLAALSERFFTVDAFREALDASAQALELSDGLGDRDLRALVLAGASGILVEVGDLSALDRVLAEGDPVIDEHSAYWGYWLTNHALVHLARHQPALAHVELERALATARESDDDRLAHDVRLNLAEACLAEGDVGCAAGAIADDHVAADASPNLVASHAYALGLVRVAQARDDEAIAAVDAAERSAPEGWIARLETVRGQALARSGRGAEAESALRRAIEVTEGQRAALEVDELKSWLLEERRQPYEALFALLAREGRGGEALAIFERAMAGSVFDGWASAADGSASGGTLRTVVTAAGARADALRSLSRSLRTSEAARPLEQDALRARIGDRHVLAYFDAGDDLWLLAVAPGRAPRALRLADRSTVQARVSEWVADPDSRVVADRLGALLLPAEALPPAGVTLHVIADDAVRDVSFAALRIEQRALVERNAVAYAPSLSVLAAIADAPRLDGVRVVLGDPAGDLPAARAEAVETGTALGVAPRVGADASVAAIRTGSGAAVLHVAAHAGAGRFGPSLHLADGAIDAGDVVDAGIKAQVVVLTACGSAARRSGSDWSALATGFLAAGSRAVVASRWAVRDDVARRFSAELYRAGGASDPIGGTAAAQRRMIEDGFEPSQWATFVVIGAATSPTRRGVKLR